MKLIVGQIPLPGGRSARGKNSSYLPCNNIVLFWALFVLGLFANLHGFAQLVQPITLKESNASLKKVLDNIKKQSGYTVFYEDSLLQISKPVTVSIRNASLEQVLDVVFQNQPLTYEIIGSKIITIKEKPTPPKANIPPANNVSASPVAITGTVKNETGDPLANVTIRVKDGEGASVVNNKGEFAMTVRPGATLVFSFVGYQPQEIVVDERRQFNITLKPVDFSLNAVVVVGYGAQKRKDITGAVSSLNEKTLREVPVTNAQQLLQGRVAGVYVTQSSNRPGALPTIRIRGTRSINSGNDPLYVIDGTPVENGLSDINPNDIESMDILKDASATAIYGARGANGVVIITTKRGREGRVNVSYNTYLGVTKVTRQADIMDAQQYIALRREANRLADGTIPPDPNIFSQQELERIAAGNNTNWTKLVVQDGFTQNHDLGIRGGSNGTRYNVTLGLYNDKGYFKTQNYTRYNMRVNLDQVVSKRIKAGASVLSSYSITDGQNSGSYYYATTEAPLGNPYKPNGSLDPQPNFPDGLMWNVLTNYEPGAVVDKEKRLRLLGTLYGEAEIARGLKYRLNFGPDLTNSRYGRFNGALTTANRGATATASNSENFTTSWTWENLLTYEKLIAKKHKLNITGLYSVQEQTVESSNVGVRDLPVESVQLYNLGLGVNTAYGSSYAKWSLESYMARINYSFDGRFLLTLTGRADGSSRFAPGHKWGFFPSGAFAWNIGDEKFLHGFSSLNNLKLRLSYGQVGNTSINPYQTQGILTSTVYDFNGTRAPGRLPGSIVNHDLRWERTAKANLGIDFGFFQNRIAGSVEVYNEKTTDLLLGFALPGTTGFDQTLRNVGSTLNKGIECTLSVKNILSRDKTGFEWTTDLNFAYNHEEILQLSQGKIDDLGNLRFIGQALNPIFDYEKTGIWQTDEKTAAATFGQQPGMIKVKDQNGDGKITPDDRRILGKTRPPLTAGLNNRFTFKNFDLGIFMVASSGHMIISPLHGTGGSNTLTLAGRYNGLDVDYWTPANPTNAYPKPRLTGNLYMSTLQYFDGSFIRIRNVNLGYTVPADLVKTINLQGVRVYLNVTNPFVFSSYVQKNKGIDPEITDAPAYVNFLLGLNVNF